MEKNRLLKWTWLVMMMFCLMLAGTSFAAQDNYYGTLPDDTCNVGIGTGGPPDEDVKLEVTKITRDDPGDGHLELSDGADNRFQFRIDNSVITNTNRSLMLDRYDDSGWGDAADPPMMTWRRRSGRVGISVDDPQSLLHLPIDSSIQIGETPGGKTYISTWHDVPGVFLPPLENMVYTMLSNTFHMDNGLHEISEDGMAILFVGDVAGVGLVALSPPPETPCSLLTDTYGNRVSMAGPVISDDRLSVDGPVTGASIDVSGATTVTGNTDISGNITVNEIAPAGASPIVIDGDIKVGGNVTSTGIICIGNCL